MEDRVRLTLEPPLDSLLELRMKRCGCRLLPLWLDGCSLDDALPGGRRGCARQPGTL